MKQEFRSFYFLVLISTGITVITEPTISDRLHDEPKSFNEALKMCFGEKTYGTFECINRGTLSMLQSWNEEELMDFGNIQFERAEGQGRDLLDLDYDPKDFKNVIKAASRLLERRNFKWDLSNVYPGLQMRVGPTLNGDGLLEFTLDERLASINERQIGTVTNLVLLPAWKNFSATAEATMADNVARKIFGPTESTTIAFVMALKFFHAGRLLMRQVMLPFLLGLKFNLASLVPLLFGVLLVITKKAFLLSKIALILIGLLGWNSVWGNASQRPGNISGGLGQSLLPYYPETQYPNQYGYRRYNRLQNAGYSPYNQHVIREIVNIYERDNNKAEESRTKKKFIWTKDS